MDQKWSQHPTSSLRTRIPAPYTLDERRGEGERGKRGEGERGERGKRGRGERRCVKMILPVCSISNITNITPCNSEITFRMYIKTHNHNFDLKMKVVEDIHTVH